MPRFADQLVKNDYRWWEGATNYGSAAYSAVHYTDFVGRTPLIGFRSPYIIGGNAPTGGVEDRWFLYSHSSYFREVPTKYLVDDRGRNIDANGNLTGNIKNDNPYLEDFESRWVKGKHHNQNTINPSIPVLVRPSKAREGVHYHETPH
ncbi:hypothetical protein BHC44_06005 [Snodgrassella alvi]|nr:hypothetical protein BHC44_06005 [Snodgrassella alvi]